jgi:hypothetical protein
LDLVGGLTDRLYEGRLFDAATGLVYHRAGRYYDPQLGLRLQPSPAGWTNNQTPTVSIEVQDLAPGLDVGSAVCEYTTDNWQSSTEVTCTCSGVAGTTLTQTITATVPFGQDSGTQNRARFQIEDQMGRLGTSGIYTVQINSSAPGGWSNFSPVGWVAVQTPTVSVQVRDLAPGLNVDSAVCEYTTDNWQSSTEVTCTCSGVNSTTLTQTITAADVPFNQDSGTQNWVKFSISDTSGYRGDSPSYPVYIDTTGPEAQIGAPRRLKTPSIPITWTASDGAGSGVAGYDLEVSEDGADWTRLLTDTQDTSYPFTGEPGHAYTFRVRGRDAVGNAGAWAEAEVSVAGVTKYYAFGGGRVAMRTPDGVFYLHTDHGSSPKGELLGSLAMPNCTWAAPAWRRRLLARCTRGKGITPTARRATRPAPCPPTSTLQVSATMLQ